MSEVGYMAHRQKMLHTTAIHGGAVEGCLMIIKLFCNQIFKTAILNLTGNARLRKKLP